MTKTCKRCATDKPLEDFHKRSASKDGLQTYCKACAIIGVRKWQEANPEKFEANWRKHSYGEEAVLKRKAARYGLTVGQLSEMMEISSGKCSICKKDKPLVVDHCHNSLKVRGLICSECNKGLGLFKDDVEALARAIEYLNK